jgi:hypothetical protein
VDGRGVGRGPSFDLRSKQRRQEMTDNDEPP